MGGTLMPLPDSPQATDGPGRSYLCSRNETTRMGTSMTALKPARRQMAGLTGGHARARRERRQCPITPCAPPRLSCDYVDLKMGKDTETCDDRGVNITGICSCERCACGAWEPRNYEYRFNHPSGYSSTEEVCFDQSPGEARYVILVTDDEFRDRIQWSLVGHGHVITGGAREAKYLDFQKLDTDSCEAPGIVRVGSDCHGYMCSDRLLLPTRGRWCVSQQRCPGGVF